MAPDTVVLELPFTGRWMARNSPARRVPSHGSHAFGETYAIDFVSVDEKGLPAPRTWRTAFGVEAPEGFLGFGVPILAPAAGTVVSVHDSEPDHSARRSQLTLASYMLGQPRRVRAGVGAITGNHVVIDLGRGGPFVLLAHLRRGSPAVEVGERLAAGQRIGECGNSGNSTQPHVHVQVTDSIRWDRAVGLPLAFRRPGDGGADGGEPLWLPTESEVFEA